VLLPIDSIIDLSCNSVDRPIFITVRRRCQAMNEAERNFAVAKRIAAPARQESDARMLLLDAARQCLRESGYSGLSTRRVAEAAAMPLSQIHYHFGSKEALVLAVLEHQNRRLLERQEATFALETMGESLRLSG
jgi:hypothetical protein